MCPRQPRGRPTPAGCQQAFREHVLCPTTVQSPLDSPIIAPMCYISSRGCRGVDFYVALTILTVLAAIGVIHTSGPWYHGPPAATAAMPRWMNQPLTPVQQVTPQSCNLRPSQHALRSSRMCIPDYMVPLAHCVGKSAKRRSTLGRNQRRDR